MKYGDFASLVQLGVGLHLGTALLQLYGEIGLAPLTRVVGRIRDLFSSDHANFAETIIDKVLLLYSDFDIFKIKLFREYVKYIKINSIFALVLAGFLALIAFRNDDEIYAGFGVTLAFLSLLPAPLTLVCLWIDASAEMDPIMQRARELEKEMLKEYSLSRKAKQGRD